MGWSKTKKPKKVSLGLILPWYRSGRKYNGCLVFAPHRSLHVRLDWCNTTDTFLALLLVLRVMTMSSVAEVFDYWAHASAIDIGEDMIAPDNFETKAQARTRLLAVLGAAAI